MSGARIPPGIFQAIVESSDDAILSKDRNATITTWNPAAERLYGYRAAEAVGRPISILIPPHRKGEERRILDRILAGERVDHYETERLTKDGRIIDVSLTISPIHHESKITGASVIARDIRERLRARERGERLQRLTFELARELRPERIVQVLLENAPLALRADAAAVALLDADGAELELVGSAGYTEALAAFERMPLDADLPIAEAVRSGDPLWVPDAEELTTRYGGLAAVPIRFASLAIVPLVVGGSPFGAIALSFGRRREFPREEQAFMIASAAQTASALDRTRRFDSERRRREQLRFLVEASEVLAASLDVDDTLDRLATLAVPTIGDWCSIDLATESGGLRNVAVAHADPARLAIADRLRERYPPDPEDQRGVSNVIRTGRSELYPSITEDLLVAAAVDEQHLRLIRELGMASAMVVPLTARGRTLGAMTLVSAESGRRYSNEDLRLAEELARHAGLAIDNATLYRREHEAAVTLQRALLPAELPAIKGAEVAASYLPAGPGLEVGGDWYDVVEADEGQLALVVGDVAGRGLAAATIMGRLRTALRAYVLEGYAPADAVARLDAVMRDLEEPSMATLVDLRLDPGQRRIEYVRAGHPPPLVRDPAGTVRQLHGHGSPPLGVFRGPVFRPNSLTFEPGSVLLLYTDGLIERRSEGISFGLERLRRVFATAPPSAQACVEGVVQQLGGDALVDDVAVVALRFLGT